METQAPGIGVVMPVMLAGSYTSKICEYDPFCFFSLLLMVCRVCEKGDTVQYSISWTVTDNVPCACDAAKL